MIVSGSVMVATTPTLIHTAVGKTRLLLEGDTGVGVGTAYLGDSGVSATNGYPLLPATSNSTALELELSDGDALYGVIPGGSTSPRVNFIATN